MNLLRPSSRYLPLAAALVAVFSAPAQAQSLLSLYESARAYDATWQSAKAQYDANLFRAEQAKAGILPVANLAAGDTRTSFNNDVPSIDRPFSTQSATVSASQPLYRPANFATYQQGKRQVELAEAQLTAASQDLIIRVSQAYFDVLAAQDTLAFVRAQKTATGEQLASAKRNFEVGTSTITDTREAQARFDLGTAQEIAAENDLRVKRLALDALVGKPDVNPVPLALPPTMPDPNPADVNVWVQQGEENSPAIQQARTGVEIAQLETEKAKAGHKPTLDAIAQWSISDSNSVNTVGTHYDQKAIGLQLHVPLYSGGYVNSQVRQAAAELDRVGETLEATRRDLAVRVEKEYRGITEGAERIRALEQAVRSSETTVISSRRSFEAGSRTVVDVLNAEQQRVTAQRDLANARYEYMASRIRLRALAGEADDQAIRELNGWLKS
jgi:outer membrane protein